MAKRQEQNDLRERAELAIAKSDADITIDSSLDIKRVLYELQLYQAELEIQNEELRQSQIELTASRDRFIDLYDFAPVGYVTVDSSGMISAANLVASDLFKVARRELERSPLSRYISPESTETLYLHYRAVRSTGERRSCEVRLVPDCDEKYVLLDTLPLSGGPGQPCNMRIAISDVTSQRVAMDERKVLEQRLLNMERLESLGEITASVAHDFNNLLCPMMTYTELALQSVEADSPIEKHLQGTMKAVQSATELVKNMLSYVESEQFTSNALDMNELIQRSIPLWQSHLSSPIELVLRTGECLHPVCGGESQIERMIMNLVINSSESIAASRGRIVITTKNLRLDETDLAHMTVGRDLAPGDFVCVEVADDGSGMDASTCTRAFDPFFSTKSTGRGLGMSAVLSGAHSHHAAIKVTSVVNRGTTIGVYFPASQMEIPVTSLPSSNDEFIGGQGRILVVDDEEFVRESTQQVLQAAGYEVELASSGADAIQMLQQPGREFDAVLLDYVMPDLNGIETLRKIRQFNQGIVALLGSGYAEPAALKELDELRVSEFIQKPSRVGELTSKLRRALLGEASQQ